MFDGFCNSKEEHERITKELRGIAREVFGENPCENLKVGATVKLHDGRTAQIVGGQFWGERGVSNFWNWREVLPDGSLSVTEEHGYGREFDFRE